MTLMSKCSNESIVLSCTNCPYRKVFSIELGNPGHHCMRELGVGHFEATAVLEVISHHGVAVENDL